MKVESTDQNQVFRNRNVRKIGIGESVGIETHIEKGWKEGPQRGQKAGRSGAVQRQKQKYGKKTFWGKAGHKQKRKDDGTKKRIETLRSRPTNDNRLP